MKLRMRVQLINHGLDSYVQCVEKTLVNNSNSSFIEVKLQEIGGHDINPVLTSTGTFPFQISMHFKFPCL